MSKKKCTFLLPIGNSINGQLLPQWFELSKWCSENNSEIKTVYGRPHAEARNFLASNGGWTIDNNKQKIIGHNSEWLIWIDSDIIFNITQIEDLLSTDYPFVSGWYKSDNSDQVMCGWLNDNFFKINKVMPFMSSKELINISKKEPKKAMKCDFVGFGFCKIKTDLIKQINYPYFTHIEQNRFGFKDLSAEDVSFCIKCFKETGIKPAVVPRLRVGHLKTIIY